MVESLIDGVDAGRFVITIARLTREELASTSPVIVEGTVQAVLLARWNTPTGKEPLIIENSDSVYHDVLISVSRVLKGEVNQKPLRVRVYEGFISDGETIKAWTSDAEPKYFVGETVLLFLNFDTSPYKKNTADSYYVTRGMFQGKFTVASGKADNTKDRLNLVDLYDIIERHKNDLPSRSIPK